MDCLLFPIVVVLSMFRLGEAAALPKENAEALYSYGKIISPLAVENVDLDGVFIFEGTYSINYQLDISELFSTGKTLISQFLPPQEICERSKNLKLFCDALEQGVMEVQSEIKLIVDKLKGLHSKSTVSGSGLARLTNLPADMKGNGTTGLSAPTKKDEFLKREVTKSIENAISKIIKADIEIDKSSVRDLASLTISKIWFQQRARVVLMENTLTKCQANHFPLRILNSKAVSTDLIIMRQIITISGFALAVPLEGPAGILKLPLVDCSVTNDQLQITLHAPVRQSGNWTLKTANPVTFMHNGENCSVLPEDEGETTVAVVDGEFSVISDFDYGKIEGGLYVVRKNDQDTQQQYSCWHQHFNNFTVSEQKYSCPFHCQKNGLVLSTIALKNAKYLVSGAKRMNMRCGTREKDIKFPEFGSLEIDLSICDCVVTLYSDDRNTRQLSSLLEFCTSQEEGFPEIVHVIPSQWTQSSSAPIGEDQRLNSLSAVFNRNWRQEILSTDKNKTDETKLDELQMKTKDMETPINIEATWFIMVVIMTLIAILITLGISCFIRWKTTAAKNDQESSNAHVAKNIV